jgi:hypothetical protein
MGTVERGEMAPSETERRFGVTTHNCREAMLGGNTRRRSCK